MTQAGCKAPGPTQTGVLLSPPDFETVVGGDAAHAVAAFPMVVFDTLGHYIRSAGLSEERRIAFNHLANDVLAVADEVSSYAGRSAARSARSVFENCVNLAEVMADDTVAQRYADHRHVITHLRAEHQAGVALMGEGEARRERKRLNQARQDSQPDLDRALATYGNQFKRQWARRNLHDRSKALGWEDGYHGYRVLSAVIHGSTGGAIGTTQDSEHGTIFRLGPAIELLPLALLAATQAVVRLNDHAEANWSGFDGAPIRSVTREVLGHWRKTRVKLRDLDRQLWPEMGVPDPAAVIAFYDSGERWYWHDPLRGIVAAADPPNEDGMPEEQREMIAGLRARRFRAQPDGRPFTVLLMGVHVFPRAGATYADAASILGVDSTGPLGPGFAGA